MEVIALDLEGTLISNAMSQIARAGLHAFLETCHRMCKRVVVFTTVKESLFRQIATLLVEEGSAPDWFKDIEYINWVGATKDLGFIKYADINKIVLVDDFSGYVHPGQEARWIEVQHFDYPYDKDDQELNRALQKLKLYL